MALPNPLHFFGRLLINFVASSVLYFLLMNLFGARILFIPGVDNPYDPLTFIKVYLHFLPGATLGFTLLWNWLTRTPDVKQFNWGAAIFYGVGIGVMNVPVCAALLCWRHEASPLLGFLFGILALILTPSFLLLGIAIGLLLGVTNASSAATWRQTHNKD